jgi:hypothetical protein
VSARPGRLHHVELWVPDLPRAVSEWGWLLTRLGYEQFQDWEAGRSWNLGGPDHYAAYLANTDGYEVELVAEDPPGR